MCVCLCARERERKEDTWEGEMEREREGPRGRMGRARTGSPWTGKERARLDDFILLAGGTDHCFSLFMLPLSSS